MRYDAFISYNHRADQSLAPALQDALQHLAKPWYRRRAMEVFRDETNLSASPELFDAIQQALDQSRYYVLMASPGSAASDWAGKEIRYWLATKTAASQRMVLVLTDGELRWDKDHECYDPDRSTALNPALRHAFASDPLFVDLRDAHKAAFERASPDGTSDSNTQLRNFRRAYRHPVAKIAARIRGVDPSELEGEDLRQHRRTLRVAWGAAACLVALTVAAAYGFISARRNAGAARAETMTAQAGELSADATAIRSSDPAGSLAVSVASYRRAHSGLARDSLSHAELQAIDGVFSVPHVGSLGTTHPLAMASDGRRVATTSSSPVGGVVLWDVAHSTSHLLTDRLLTDRPAMTVVQLAFSHNGGTLAVAYSSTRSAGSGKSTTRASGRVALFDVRTHRERAAWDDDASPISAIAFAPKGVTLAVGDEAGRVLEWDTSSGLPRDLAQQVGFAVSSLTFDADGGQLAVGTSVTLPDVGGVATAVIVNAASGATTLVLPVDANEVESVAFSPDGATVVTGDDRGRIILWNAATGERGPEWDKDVAVRTVAFYPSGDSIISGDVRGEVALFDVASLGERTKWSVGTVAPGLAIDERGATIATADDQGTVVLWDTDRLVPSFSADGDPGTLAFGPTNGTLITCCSTATADTPKSATRWNVAFGIGTAMQGTDAPAGIMVSADGKRVAVVSAVDAASGQSSITVSNVQDARVIRTWEVSGQVWSGSLGEHGRRLVTQSRVFDGTTSDLMLDAWDVTSGRALGTAEIRNAYPVNMGVSPDGTTVAMAGADSRIHLWNLARHRQSSFADGSGPPLELVFSPDGRTLALVHDQGKVVLRDLASGRDALAGDGAATISTVAFSPDGRTLALGDAAHRVVLWDVAGARHGITTWTIPGPVEGVAFSADGRRVAASDVNGQVSSDEDGAAPTHQSTEINVFDAFAYLASPARLVEQLCHELRGYDPNSTAWHKAVPYLRYSQVCP